MPVERPTLLELFARSPVAIVGAYLTTVSAFLFLAFWVMALRGAFHNPYVGLITMTGLPALFVLGLLLIPLGLWLAVRRHRKGSADASAWPVLDLNRPRVRHGILAVALLTLVNVVILSIGSYGAVEHLDSPSFCGRTCHTPMEPQYTAWKHGPHSNVPCVDCHIGGGARAFVRYKWNGVHQMIGVLTGRYPRPIPVPVRNMRPSAEICGACHAAVRPHGDRTLAVKEYADDAGNTETVTTVRLHVDRGAPVLLPDGSPHWRAGSGIHWHADPANRVEFVATDDRRQVIPWIRVTSPDGATREYRKGLDAAAGPPPGERRVMECVDCHNQPVHQFPASAERAVDRALAEGRVDRALPFVRREAVRLLKASYPGQVEALAGIASGIRTFYEQEPATGGRPDPQKVEAAVQQLQAVYRESVFPAMKVTFGTYPSNVGHTDSPGCFRCHDGEHAAADGKILPGDCDTCHTLE